MSVDRSKMPTCGVLFREALEFYTGMDPEKVILFCNGFNIAEAEKVHLGACKAAMIRPSAEHHAERLEMMKDTAKRYALSMVVVKDEIWITRPENEMFVRGMLELQENSPEWHELRGMLCGIPPEEIDRQFHFRRGYGQRAD